ncbi:MAG TPA: alpha/beta hydrolase, partial [Chitinophagaceae bacterium]|nr:alpha/beta hydrolase [Chitinophagaceae bacterium]
HSFEKLLAHLPLSVHAYVLSQRGHGNSAKPGEGYTPSDFAADVAAFMKQLKIESAVIVGHSMGATIAQRFVLDHPELSKALVLIGSLASFKDKPGLVEFSHAVDQLQDPVDSAFVYEFQKSTLAKQIPEPELNMYVKESRKLTARIWKETMKGMMATDYQTELTKIKVPTLIIWGDKDLIAPKSDQDILLSGIKHSRLIVYEGTGHAVHWEEPVRFANDLLNFINKSL